MKSLLAHRRNLAFTLLELMLVIGIITLLIGLLFAGITAARKAARNSQAVSTISTISTGLNGYFSTYGFWPSFTGTSITIINSGTHFVNCMMGNLSPAVGNFTTISNPRGIRFCDLPSSNLLGPTNFQTMTDPYGKTSGGTFTIYQIYFDTNNDNWISITDNALYLGFPAAGSLNRTIAITSYGPNRIHNWGTFDDHKNW